MGSVMYDTTEGPDLPSLDMREVSSTTEAGRGPDTSTAASGANEIDMQALRSLYEQRRVDAVATLDHLAATVQLASATLRWNADDVATLGSALGQIDQHAINLRNAVQARLDLVDVAEGRADARQAPQTPPPAPAAPAEPLPAPEVHLLTMVRCLEVVRLRADELLRAAQTQPREGEPIFGRLEQLQSYAEAATMAYVEYALGVNAEARG